MRLNERYCFFLLWPIAGPLIFLSEAVFIFFQICVLRGPQPFLFDHVCLYRWVFRFFSSTLFLFSTDGTKFRILFSLGETNHFPSSDASMETFCFQHTLRMATINHKKKRKRQNCSKFHALSNGLGIFLEKKRLPGRTCKFVNVLQLIVLQPNCTFLFSLVAV